VQQGSRPNSKGEDRHGVSDAGAAGARAHRLGLTLQGASALSIHGKDTHTLTALKKSHPARFLVGGVSIIWERPRR
jgi:hypothetical protein